MSTETFDENEDSQEDDQDTNDDQSDYTDAAGFDGGEPFELETASLFDDS